MNGNLTHFSYKNKPSHTNNVTNIKKLFKNCIIKSRVIFRTNVLSSYIYLNSAFFVLQLSKRCTAHDTARHDPSCKLNVLKIIQIRFKSFFNFQGIGIYFK